MQAESGRLAGRGGADQAPIRRAGASASGSAAPSPRSRRGGGRETGAAAPATASTSTCRSAEVIDLVGRGQRASATPRRAAPGHRRASGRSRHRRSSRPSTATSGSAPTAVSSSTTSCVLIERPDLLGDEQWALRVGRQRGKDEWNEIVHAWTPKHTTAEIVRLRDASCASRSRRSHAARTSPTCDALRRAQRLRRRPHRLVQDAAPTVAHRRRRSATAATGTPPRRAHRGDRAALTCRPRPSAGPHGLPLAGVRVLDLTAWWAGPGGRGRARGARRRRDPRGVDQPHRRHAHHGRDHRDGGPWWERSAHYLCSNTNKRDLTLDLSTRADGSRLLQALIAGSRRGLENFTPRVLGNFGLELGAGPCDQPAVPAGPHARIRPVRAVA